MNPPVAEGDRVRVVLEGRAHNVSDGGASFSVAPADRAWGGVRITQAAPYVTTVEVVEPDWQPGDVVTRRWPGDDMSVAVYHGHDRWRVQYSNGSYGDVSTRACLRAGLAGGNIVTPLVRGGKPVVA